MKKIIYFVVIVIIGLLVYRYYFIPTNQQPSLVINSVKEAVVPTDKDSCEAKGGKWEQVDNPSSMPACNLPTTDSGKICTDSSQCESYCQAPSGAATGAKVSGTCFDFTKATCMKEIKNGLADAEWCQ